MHNVGRIICDIVYELDDCCNASYLEIKLNKLLPSGWIGYVRDNSVLVHRLPLDGKYPYRAEALEVKIDSKNVYSFIGDIYVMLYPPSHCSFCGNVISDNSSPCPRCGKLPVNYPYVQSVF